MDIETEYAAKLFFANPAFIQVYLEALANALDAGATEVSILISSDGRMKAPLALEIAITDNGQGFTDERFDGFRRLKKPRDKYHKGLGRLVYLHYFSSVHVDSVFESQKRSFTFSHAFKGHEFSLGQAPSTVKTTTLRFKQFSRDRLHSYDDLKPGMLKERLLEHFLPRFYDMKKAGQDFMIRIELDVASSSAQKDFLSDMQTITPDDIPQLECKTFADPSIDAFAEISMYYMLKQGFGEKLNLTAICVDKRTIPLQLLHPKAIPPNHSAVFLFECELLNGKSDSSRQRVVFPEGVSEPAFYALLRRQMSAVLNERFLSIGEANRKTKQQFEERYPHLSGLFEEDTVGMIDKDEAIEIAQHKFFKQQKEILESETIDDATFEKSLEVSSRTLTEYILYREIIIKKLSNISSENKEEDIHQLIVPQRRRFHEHTLMDGIYNNNAWLLDDKFMSFRTILSEAEMRDVIDAITLSDRAAPDVGRPDISMIFSAHPSEAEKVDVVIVELKRRRADDKENSYAHVQLTKRARKLAEYCPKIQRAFYFAIIEMDQEFATLLKDQGWLPLFSRGQVFYKEHKLALDNGQTVYAPIYILSYGAVIEDAAARNHTFLEILRTDLKKAAAQKANSDAGENKG